MKAQRTKTQATGWENDITKFKDVIALTVHLSDGKIPYHDVITTGMVTTPTGDGTTNLRGPAPSHAKVWRFISQLFSDLEYRSVPRPIRRVNRLYYGFGSNLYENLVSNNFKTAVLKRNVYC